MATLTEWHARSRYFKQIRHFETTTFRLTDVTESKILEKNAFFIMIHDENLQISSFVLCGQFVEMSHRCVSRVNTLRLISQGRI